MKRSARYRKINSGRSQVQVLNIAYLVSAIVVVVAADSGDDQRPLLRRRRICVFRTTRDRDRGSSKGAFQSNVMSGRISDKFSLRQTPHSPLTIAKRFLCSAVVTASNPSTRVVEKLSKRLSREESPDVIGVGGSIPLEESVNRRLTKAPGGRSVPSGLVNRA